MDGQHGITLAGPDRRATAPATLQIAPGGVRAKTRRGANRTNRAARRSKGQVLERPRVDVIKTRYQAAKRVLDLMLCTLALPIVLPVLLLCAALLWLNDPGPVLFRQLRTGRGGRRFKMYKFRTMVRDAERLKEKYAHLNELAWPDFKISDDPRVTRIGRILRRTSLDELPQILNVFKGDMSLVGPRPTSFSATTYALWHTERLEVLPGITGLWQVSGRSDLGFDERLRLDIEYIERQSLWLDLVILARTVTAVFAGRGAY
jgi:lipopolysaccharide/colanic/teichoic acid biosynthesis glycosyltransferase